MFVFLMISKMASKSLDLFINTWIIISFFLLPPSLFSFFYLRTCLPRTLPRTSCTRDGDQKFHWLFFSGSALKWVFSHGFHPVQYPEQLLLFQCSPKLRSLFRAWSSSRPSCWKQWLSEHVQGPVYFPWSNELSEKP